MIAVGGAGSRISSRRRKSRRKPLWEDADE
jgi:hypothetical protein